MKNKILIVAVLALAMVFTSCQKEDGPIDSNNSRAEIQEVSDLVVSGAWKIVSFIDSGSDETIDFTGYGFSFNPDGTLVANNGSNTVDGTWSITDDNSSDDNSSSDDIDFNIFFANPPNFNELSEDWDIVSRSNVKIELMHVSGGNGGTDLLTFEKN